MMDDQGQSIAEDAGDNQEASQYKANHDIVPVAQLLGKLLSLEPQRWMIPG
jgi:hypothetical protein